MWAWILNSEAEKQTVYGLLYQISIINAEKVSDDTIRDLFPFKSEKFSKPGDFY